MAKSKSQTVPTSKIFAAVANHFEELPKKVTKELLVTFLETIEQNIVKGNKVRVDKIGILACKHRAARKGRNPQTGEEIKIPASKKISFRAAKSLKELVGVNKKKKKK